jgi:hypothetical protein
VDFLKFAGQLLLNLLRALVVATREGFGDLFAEEKLLLSYFGAGQRVTIPHANPALRSLNLSTAAGIATYEAIRQFTRVAS